jgi:TRAP-type C4-dicarboxylate transport system permease small subunit
MTRLADALGAILRVLCVILFAALVLVVLWQVFTRQVVNQPSTWTTTVAQYLLVWLSLFGSAWVFSEKEHIAVDFFTRLLKIDRRRGTEIAVNVAILLFAVGVLVWGGARGVGLTWTQQIPGLPITIGMMYLALPVSGIITAFFAVHHIAEAIHGRGLPSEGFDADDIPEAV